MIYLKKRMDGEVELVKCHFPKPTWVVVKKFARDEKPFYFENQTTKTGIYAHVDKEWTLFRPFESSERHEPIDFFLKNGKGTRVFVHRDKEVSWSESEEQLNENLNGNNSPSLFIC